MDRERAETHLRLLAEAEPRRALKIPAAAFPVGGIPPGSHWSRRRWLPWALSAPTLRLRSRPTSSWPSLVGAGSMLAWAPARDASGRHPDEHRGG